MAFYDIIRFSRTSGRPFSPLEEKAKKTNFHFPDLERDARFVSATMRMVRDIKTLFYVFDEKM
jgi:hypothetical protein